jgi:exopolysaccharide biosynthesis WecB/TagA/CpsF family protein
MHEILVKVKKSPDIYHHFESLLCEQENCDRKTELVSFVNPYSYMVLHDHPNHYKSVDSYYSDATSSSIMFSLLFLRKIPRISFDHGSFARYFLERMNDTELPVYFVGAKEDEIAKAVVTFKKKYPKLNVSGFRDGYFDDLEQVAEDIKNSGAKFVICGMGTPYQEKFGKVLKCIGQGQIKQVYTCGGFLHQSGAKVDYYPSWINKYHLRWLYRALNEPYVFKRLLNQYPRFIFTVFIERLR